MRSTLHPRLAALSFGTLMLVALACTCGPLSQLSSVRATAAVAQNTVEAVATEFGKSLPTLEAEMTQLVDKVTQNAPMYEASLTAVVATADALAGRVQGEPGTVTGAVCYPSEMIPPMIIYARNIASGQLFELPHQTATQYTFSGLPAGDYHFFAYTDFGDPASELPGGYTEFLFCSSDPKDCPHTLIPVHVEPGQTVTGIDICDWYAPPGDTSFPPNPKSP